MPVERTPTRNGDLPALVEGEELKFSQQQIRLYAGQNLEGEGILHLTNRRIVWLGSQNVTQGYSIDYPFVGLHAVSRDKAAWPEPCLYCQLRTEEHDGDEDDAPDIPELRFVPADATHLQHMYIIFSEMSSQNIDPLDPQANDSSSDEEDEDEALPPAQGQVWAPKDNDAAMEDLDDSEDDEDDDAMMEDTEMK